MILINNSFWNSVGVVSFDGNPDGTQYGFYNSIEMSNGETVYSQYDFFLNSPIDGVYYSDQYEWYKAIGVFHSEPIYDQYTFMNNATFDGVNPIGNQYDFFKDSGGVPFSLENSFNFDGTKRFEMDYTALNALFKDGNDFTLFAAFRFDAAGANEVIFGNAVTAARTVLLSVNSDDKVVFQNYNGGFKFMRSSDILDAGNCYFVAVSIDKATPSNNAIYINSVAAGIEYNDLTTTFPEANSMYGIGAISGGSLPWDGEISFVGAIDRTTNPSEMADFFNNSSLSMFDTYFGANSVMNFSAPNSNDTAQFTWTDTGGVVATSVGMVDADKLDISCTPTNVGGKSDVFDSLFVNSYIYSDEVGYDKRAAGGEYTFTYDHTYLGLRFHWIFDTLITVMVDGSPFSTHTITDNSLLEITLPAGVKTVTIIEGVIANISTIKGVFLNSVIVYPDTYTKINEVSVSEKLAFLTDSIGQGVASGGNPMLVCFPKLFKYDDLKEVVNLGWAEGELAQMASTTPLVNGTVTSITTSLSNATTTKKLIILIGTNDFGLSALPSATFKTYYENLVDAVTAADSSIEIFCISPLLRSTDAPLLDDYRTAINDLCTVRPSFCTYIEGKTIITLLDTTDGLHLSVAGQQKVKDHIDSIIL